MVYSRIKALRKLKELFDSQPLLKHPNSTHFNIDQSFKFAGKNNFPPDRERRKRQIYCQVPFIQGCFSQQKATTTFPFGVICNENCFPIMEAFPGRGCQYHCTSHKNLGLWEVQFFTVQQIRWEHFIFCFDFCISNIPGSQTSARSHLM